MSAEQQIDQLSRNLNSALRSNQRQLVNLIDDLERRLKNIEGLLYSIQNATRR